MEEWLTVAEVAQRLKVGEETVRRWIRAGRIGARLLSRKGGYRISAAELARFMAGDIDEAAGEVDRAGKAAA